MLERRFGSATVAHIREMTAYRLERHLLDGRLDIPPVLLPAETAGPADPGERIQLQVPDIAMRTLHTV
jgi:hypothetical protein